MLKHSLLVCAATIGLSDAMARAVIIAGDGTSGTGRNTTAPTGNLAGSGWNLEGTYGDFLGTPVSSTYFLTAAHFGGGNAGETITMPDGSVHTLTGVNKPVDGTDLVLHQVSASTPFTSFASLYDPSTDGTLSNTSTLVVFGRGTARGAAVSGKGWQWGAQDGVKSWGTNTSDGLYTVTAGDGSGFAAGTQFITADFDQTSGGTNEATLSGGDSGGGVFVQSNGVWKLVGINYGVEVVRAAASSTSPAIAAYDTVGLYVDNNNGTFTGPIAGPSPVPQGWDASYVGQASSLAVIRSTVPEPASLGLIAIGAVGLLRRRRA